MTTAPAKMAAAMGDDADLEGSLRKMPFDVAHAAARLAWHEAWRAALLFAEKCGKEKPLFKALDKALDWHKKNAKEAREAWSGVGGRWAESPRGAKAAGEVTQAVLDAAKAAAEHTATLRVYTMASVKGKKSIEKLRTEADVPWRKFEKAMNVLKGHKGVLAMSLRDSVLEMLWAVCWHAANTIGDKVMEVELEEDDDECDEDDEDDEDDEEEDEEDESDDEDAVFGEDYLGSSDDAVMDLANALDSLKECFWVEKQWCGVRLPATSGSLAEVEAQLEAMAAVPGVSAARGLNAVRLVLPDLSAARDTHGALGEMARALLEKAQSLDLRVLLDVPAKPEKKHEAWLKLLAAAVAPFSCVRGVALPAIGDDTLESAGLVYALRNGGLTAERCMVLVPLPGGQTENEDGEWTESYAALHQSDPAETSLNLLLRDGNVQFEKPLTFDTKDEGGPATPQELLDAASQFREEANSLGVVSSWSLAVPSDVKVKPSKTKSSESIDLSNEWYGEFAQRLIGSMNEAHHGWFFESWLPSDDSVSEERSFKACLEKGWVDLSEDVQTMQPTGGSHKATLVYLHGFQCDGFSYIIEPQYFYRPKPKKKGVRSKNKKKGDQDDDKEVEYEPIPGVKVVLPSAPVRKITCYDGQELPSWYDYITDYDGEQEDDLAQEDLEEQARRVHQILDAEVERVGARNVFLGGASQGCAVAVHAALTYPGELGGVIGCMGHLLSCTEVTEEWVAKKIPVYVYNGLADTTMPWDTWVKQTWQRLEDAGVDVKIHLEEGADHGEAEDSWTRAFLAEVLRPSTVKTVAKKTTGKK